MTYKVGKLPIHIERLKKGWPLFQTKDGQFKFKGERWVSKRHAQHLLPMCTGPKPWSEKLTCYIPVPEKIKPPAFLEEA